MKTKIWMGMVVAGLLLFAGFWNAQGEEAGLWAKLKGRGADFAPAADERYLKECGACHMAYPPGLLPARSWEKLMGGLSDHFGDNAELSPADQKGIADYLTAGGADRSSSKRAMKIVRSLRPDETPIRIQEVPYIARKHREIADRMVQGNPKVKSLGRCNACHAGAEKGSFNEETVSIPGYGRAGD